jgi:membrane fusion protein, heavy metal efflux system
MNRKAIIIVIVLSVGILALVNCKSDPDHADCDGHDEHPQIEKHENKRGHDGHGHETAKTPCETACSADRLGDLEKIICEHEVGIIDCDNCRFEVGIVKIDPSVAKSLIETAVVKDIEHTKVFNFTGQVQLDLTKTVEVVSAGAGRVEQVSKLLGEKVEKSDVLAVIHSADLSQAKADFLEVQAKLELSQATFKREKELYEKKVSSEADYLNALNELRVAEASYVATDKRLNLFGLKAEQIGSIKDEKKNEDFANLVLQVPQSGTIIRQNISAGKIVGTTESLYTIADLSNLWVWCDVYEKDLAVLHEQLSRGNQLRATVHVKAFAVDKFEGVVDLIGNVMDEHTRTVKIRVQVKNLQGKLRPGMFAEVEVIIPGDGRMTAVPRNAIMTDANENFVFQHWKDDLWARSDVTVGSMQGDFVEILSGIPNGATIVTGGAFMLKSDILREKMGAGCAD